MSQSKKNWQLNPAHPKRSILFFAVAVIAATLYVAKFSVTSHGQLEPILILIGAAISISGAALITRISFRRFILKSISVESDAFTIPRLFLKDYHVEFKQVRTLDVFGAISRKQTAIISRRIQSPISISEDLFMSRAHFNEFILQINKNLNVQEDHNISSGSTSSFGRASTHAVSITIAAIIAISYIALSNEFETIDQAALDIGGLTKNSLSQAEFYRLFTSFFLHHNLPHLVLNLIALGIFARPTELIIGKHRCINVIFTSALVGSFFSLLFSRYELVAGASGGILGLIGAYTALHFKFKNKLVGSAFIPQNTLLTILFAQVVSDSFLANVDSISHLFGFLAGAIYAMYICRSSSLQQAAHHNRIERLYSFVLSATFLCSLIFIFMWHFNS